MTAAAARGASTGEGTASAKVILLGEHFVVHGVPALSLPVPTLTVRVRLSVGGGAPAPGRSEHVAACLAICHERLGGPSPEAVTVDAAGEVPVSAGLGSSAALAVATARAWCALAGVEPTEARLRGVADACERLAHGNPSGIDVSTVLAQRPLRFVRGAGAAPLPVGGGLGLLVLDSGEPGRTRETVAHVAALREADPADWEARADLAGALVTRGERALAAGEASELGAVMNQVHELLGGLGVSTPALEAAAAAARAAGADGAKLTGGGGGGCVVAVCAAAARAVVAERAAASGARVVASFDLAPWDPA